MCDKLILNLSQQTGRLENFIFIMNYSTMKTFLSELTNISDYRIDDDGAIVHQLIRYKRHRLVIDISMRDGEVCMMNWENYEGEKDRFKCRQYRGGRERV